MTAVRYCQKCGAECNMEATGAFDADTGLPVYREVCSIAPCEHGSHDDISEWRTGRLLWVIPDPHIWYVCKRCGREEKLITWD